MPKQNQEFIQKELNTLIDRFTRDRNRHKVSALYLKLFTTILAALSMILLGWEHPASATVFKNFALIFNGCIGFFAAYEAFFEPRKLWIRETILLSRLKDISRDLEYEKSKSADIAGEKLDQYKRKIDTVLNESLSNWTKDKISL